MGHVPWLCWITRGYPSIYPFGFTRLVYSRPFSHDMETSWNGGTPRELRMVYFMENPKQKWMITGGYPHDSGYLHIETSFITNREISFIFEKRCYIYILDIWYKSYHPYYQYILIHYHCRSTIIYSTDLKNSLNMLWNDSLSFLITYDHWSLSLYMKYP